MEGLEGEGERKGERKGERGSKRDKNFKVWVENECIYSGDTVTLILHASSLVSFRFTGLHDKKNHH